MKEIFKDKFEKWLAIGVIGAVVFFISIVLAVIYVAFHFLQKYW